MLTRISGGTSGFADYLENGQKAGREFTRDELDKRIPLAGDLAHFENVVNAMQTEGERYMHVTLSFKEHHISEEMLKAITEEFRQFAFAAYGSEEYCMYAEAHIPKIKTCIDKATSRVEERLPHIHIGIPRENLLTGEGLMPFGKVSINEHFIDAFQEHVNAKYGLISPKDAPRIEIKDAADMLGRYGAAEFYGQRHIDIKTKLAREILSGEISSFDDLKKAAARYGIVDTGKKGKPGEYIKVYMPGQVGGNGKPVAMRLEKTVFSRAFLEKSPTERQAIAEQAIQKGYREAQQAKKEPEKVARTLTEWYSTRARELKHIHFGSKFYKSEYKPANAETRRQLLDKLDTEFNQKWRPLNEHRPRSIARVPPPFRRDRLHHVSELDVARNAERGEMLLPRDVPAHLDNERAGADRGMRRAGDRAGRGLKGGGQPSNVVDFYRAELADAYARANDKDKYTEIRKNIDPARLLAHLARSHSLDLQLYQVGQGKDGTPRIVAGSRSMTPNDFLTKEMGLPWKEAAPILRAVYERQLGHEHEATRQHRASPLWADFAAQYQIRRQANTTELARFNESAKGRRQHLAASLKNAGASKRQALKTMTPEERQAAIALAKMQNAAARAELNAAIIRERAEIRARLPKMTDGFTTYLAEQAQQGNEQALAELQKREAVTVGKEETRTTITPAHVEQAEHAARLFKDLSFRVLQTGHVEYQVSGKVALRDEGARVAVLAERDTDTIATGLRLAVEKYGRTLTLTGNAEFQRRAVAVAVQQGIQVTFADPTLEAYRRELIAQQEAERRAPKRQAAPAAEKPALQAEPQPAPLQPKPAPQATLPKAAEPPAKAAAPVAIEPLPRECRAADPGQTYTGRIEEITRDWAVQNLGRGKYIAHRLDSFNEVARADLKEGDLLEVKTGRDGRSGAEVIGRGKGVER